MEFTTERWNDLLGQFLEELHEQFPSVPEVASFRATLAAAKIFDEQAPVRKFVDSLEPHAHLLRERDPAFFERLGSIGGVNFERLWNSTRDEHTRTVIFDFLVALFTGGYKILYDSADPRA